MVQFHQITDDVARSKIRNMIGEQFETWATLLNDKLNNPLDIRLAAGVITIEAATKQRLKSNNAGGTNNSFKKRLPYLNDLDIDPVESMSMRLLEW
jgi:hypothetical protein